MAITLNHKENTIVQCIYDRKKPAHEIFTNPETYKVVGAELLIAVGINTLAALVLGGGKKQAALLGTTSALGFQIAHFTVHQTSNQYVAYALFLLSGPIISCALSHFTSTPLLSLKNASLAIIPLFSHSIRIYAAQKYINS